MLLTLEDTNIDVGVRSRDQVLFHHVNLSVRGEELLGSYTKDGYAWFMRTGTREIAPLDLEQKCEDYARNFVLADRDVTVLACWEKCGEGAEKQPKTGGWKLIRS